MSPERMNARESHHAERQTMDARFTGSRREPTFKIGVEPETPARARPASDAIKLDVLSRVHGALEPLGHVADTVPRIAAGVAELRPAFAA